MSQSTKFFLGNKVWFTGQNTPRLAGNNRLVCLVIGINDPHCKYMRSYEVREISTGEISNNNFADMLELIAD